MTENYNTGYNIEYLPEGYYRCSRCKTLVPIASSLEHECITNQTQVTYTFNHPTDRELLEEILKELREIRRALRGPF